MTAEGFEVWDLVQRCTQFRFYPNGKVAGLDTTHVLKIAQILGYDEYAAVLLLEYLEPGLQEALNECEARQT